VDTKPNVSLAYGPGILATGASTIPTSFIIWSKDRNGKQRKSGGDTWSVNITYSAVEEDSTAEPKTVTAAIEDMNDGTYFIQYTPPEAGTYTVSVTLDKAHVRGSPWTIERMS